MKVMKQMYYQNRECGNLHTYPGKLKEWAELFDGATPQIPVVGWNTIPALAPSKSEGVFLAARGRLLRAAFPSINRVHKFSFAFLRNMTKNIFPKMLDK